MKINIQNILKQKWWNLALWSFIIGCTLFLLIWVNRKEKGIIVNKIEVNIEPKFQVHFLDSTTILKTIQSNIEDDEIIGKPFQNFSTNDLEKYLEENPYVEKAEIFCDLKGVLNFKIKQRIPVMRVFNSIGQSYYVSNNGIKMPVNSMYSARVLVASGNISETLIDSNILRSQLLKDLWSFALYISQDEFWNSQIEQLYVDNFNDINLIPKVGSHNIVVGSAQRMEEKFKMLKTFYIKGLNNLGWSQYKTINLKYSNQIVATKKEEIN